ncbi:MAG TPA: D-amino acid dehydrogenase [Burkholderiaceae bacterium]|nr:D-amino acid dehydrogenase [Burkholderiaceae bacterium]
MTHIAVLGAGITGVTTAYALTLRGYDVTVLEYHRYAAMETSFANGGQLSACNAEVWNNTSTVVKGMKWMMRRDAPLLMNPRPSWHKYSWMAEFVRNIPHYRDNTIETARLAIAARDHMFRIAETEQIEFNLERRGILHIFHNAQDFDDARKVNTLLTEAGLERNPVTPEEIKSIEPSLTGEYYGGFYTPSDSTGDIHRFTRGLTEACKKRGVQFRFDADVTGITSLGDGSGVRIDWQDANAPAGQAPEGHSMQVDGIIICAGVASRKFASSLGDRVNIYPVKGYSITVHMDDPDTWDKAPYVSLLDEDAKIVTSRLGDDRLRVAGTAEYNGYNLDIRADRIDPLIKWTRRHFDVDTNRVVSWAGLRPMMPNMMPHVGRGKKPGIFYNTGHGHLGWTLAPITAETICATLEADLPVPQ